MKLLESIRILSERQQFLTTLVESGRLKPEESTYRNEEVKSLEIAIKCIELCMSYGIVCLTNVGEPLYDMQMHAELYRVADFPSKKVLKKKRKEVEDCMMHSVDITAKQTAPTDVVPVTAMVRK